MHWAKCPGGQTPSTTSWVGVFPGPTFCLAPPSRPSIGSEKSMVIQCTKLWLRCLLHPPAPKQIMCSKSKQSHFGQPCVNDSWGMALPQSLCVCVWCLKAPARPSASPPGSQSGFGASHSLGQSNDANVAPVTSWFLGKLPLDRLRVVMPLPHTPP